MAAHPGSYMLAEMAGLRCLLYHDGDLRDRRRRDWHGS